MRAIAGTDVRWLRSLVTSFFGLALLTASCQGVLGIEDWTPKATADAGGCLLPSDCPSLQVCLFRMCSVRCQTDKDCPAPTRCLATDDETACVSAAQAACSTDEPCPGGSVCTAAGECFTACGGAATDCLDGQRCDEGICVSELPDASAGGAGGTAGGDGGAAGSVGGNGGAAGSAGSGLGGSGGDGGGPAAGAGGTAAGGTGGLPSSDAGLTMDAGDAASIEAGDGTAIVSYNDPCDEVGAGACVGHASDLPALCDGSAWTPVTRCSTGTLCDSTPGATAGTCRTIEPECDGELPGHSFCRDMDRRECGIDLVTSTLLETCPAETSACVDGACIPCASGTANCDADATTCEIDLNDVTACGTTCNDRIACSTQNGTPSCTDGVCGMAGCNPSWGDCVAGNDGCETNLDDRAACGTTCGNRVACTPPNPGCAAGVCVECTVDGDCPGAELCGSNACACGAVEIPSMLSAGMVAYSTFSASWTSIRGATFYTVRYEDPAYATEWFEWDTAATSVTSSTFTRGGSGSTCLICSGRARVIAHTACGDTVSGWITTTNPTCC